MANYSCDTDSRVAIDTISDFRPRALNRITAGIGIAATRTDEVPCAYHRFE
jgi:hypothetical protein